MAEPATSESSPDTDRDFDPSADMMVNDFDDETTLDDEEALSNNSDGVNELDELQKEGEMPMEDLLAMYGSGGGMPIMDNPDSNDTRSSSEEEILSNQDLTLDKDEIARDLLKNDEDKDKETTVTDLLESVHVPSQTARLLRSQSQPGSSEDDSEDEDYQPEVEDDWKKYIQVGPSYQAHIPDGLSKYGDAPAYENEDRLLWDPSKLEDAEVERYLREVKCQNNHAAQGVHAIPLGDHVRDDEQALYLLLQCGHNVEEALRRRKMQTAPATDPMSLWSEEECRNFENGLRTYGKDFYQIQQTKVRTRSVGELVQFYYLWKKTERHDVFANKTRLEKKKYTLHPGVTDYMDRFIEEQENPAPPRDRSCSPNIHSLLYGDPKRHSHELRSPVEPVASEAEIVAAIELVKEVVPDWSHRLDFSPVKLHPENQEVEAAVPVTTSATSVAISTETQASQSAQNLVYSASFTPVAPAPVDQGAESTVAKVVQPAAVPGKLDTARLPTDAPKDTVKHVNSYEAKEREDGDEPCRKRLKTEKDDIEGNCVGSSASPAPQSSSPTPLGDSVTSSAPETSITSSTLTVTANTVAMTTDSTPNCTDSTITTPSTTIRPIKTSVSESVSSVSCSKSGSHPGHPPPMIPVTANDARSLREAAPSSNNETPNLQNCSTSSTNNKAASNMALAIASVNSTIHSLGDGGSVAAALSVETSKSPPLATAEPLAQ